MEENVSRVLRHGGFVPDFRSGEVFAAFMFQGEILNVTLRKEDVLDALARDIGSKIEF